MKYSARVQENFKDLMGKFLPKPPHVSAQTVKDQSMLTDDQRRMIQDLGAFVSDMSSMVNKQTLINFERTALYREIDRAITYPLIGSAIEMYADVATNYNSLHNATVWVTSDNKQYEYALNKLLDKIGVEEKIFDWAWTTGSYGDLFVRVNGVPGVGIVSIEDDQHPINISRLDKDGTLVGFFDTPLGHTTEMRRLMPPWEFVHFRMLGAKKKRPLYGDPMYSEFRTVTIMGPDSRRITSKYGTSLLINSLSVYKRLRLSEDSLLMARLSRGVLRYMYKVRVDGANMEAVATIVNQYKALLKRARAMDTNPNTPFYDEKYQDLSTIEDLIIPVWGDVNNLAVEELGGKTDIKWITDIEELRNQLASSLRVPLQLMGGYSGEMPSGLGRSALENLDVRFARSCRRLQRALIEGITRLCQIHLSYMNMSPDPHLFQVNMAETSTAEEAEIKDALEKGVDISDRFTDWVLKLFPEADKAKLADYLNQKVLKLTDFDVDAINKSPTPEGGVAELESFYPVSSTDLRAMTKVNEDKWKELYGECEIQSVPLKEG